MQKSCSHCHNGYIRKNGVYVPCKHCITPERFEKTLNTAIANCGDDIIKKKTLRRIKNNLPDFPVMAMMEAENYGEFNKEFVEMLREAYDIKPFMDVKYKEL